MKQRRRNSKRDNTEPFKRCPLCGKEWRTKEFFLKDITVHLNGYQWNSRNVLAALPAHGLLVFTHRVPSCGTTMAIHASEFRNR